MYMFNRLEKLIGEESINKIHTKTVAVIGLGGVGGYSLETLIRNGIENIIIVDNDVVDETNKNRQIIALDSSIGKYKVDVFEKRIKDINKNVNITKLKIFLNEETIRIDSKIYKYPHDYKGSYVKQQYMPDNLINKKYYEAKLTSKYEQSLNEIYKRIEKINKTEE